MNFLTLDDGHVPYWRNVVNATSVQKEMWYLETIVPKVNLRLPLGISRVKALKDME